MRDLFSSYVFNKLKEDDACMVVVADHGHDIFRDVYSEVPEKYLNVGIAEQNLYGVAAGLTNAGVKPIAYALVSLGLTRAFDQIRLDIAFSNKPVLVVGDGVGFVYGTQGETHHGIEDIGLMSSLPNLRLFSPSDKKSMERCLEHYYANSSPVYIRISKNAEGDVYENDDLSIDRPNFVISGTSSKCVISTASMTATVKRLIKENDLKIDLIDIICCNDDCVAPVADMVKGYDEILVIEEHLVTNGIGSKVALALAEAGVAVKSSFMGVRFSDNRMTGNRGFYLEKYGIDEASIVVKMREMNR